MPIKRFWISWYQPTDDWRPVYDPAMESEPFGHRYWCSGQRCGDDAWTVCAIVEASDAHTARCAVQKYWPEAFEWRFCEEKAMDWTPGDRFPIPSTKEAPDAE